MFIEPGSSYNIKIMGAIQLLQRADELEKRVSNHINLHADDIHAFSSSRALVSKAEVLTREVEEAIVKAESKGQRDSELQHFKNILNELKKHKDENKMVHAPEEVNMPKPAPSQHKPIEECPQNKRSMKVSFELDHADQVLLFFLILVVLILILVPGPAPNHSM